MKPFTRTLLTVVSVVAAAAAAAGEIGLGPSFKGPLGLQLYSLRDQFAKDVPGSLATVKGFGIKNAELAGTYSLSPEKFHEMLLGSGIAPISTHFGYDRYKTNLADVVKEAKALGVKFAGCAWIPHDGGFTEAKCREAIGVFNRAGEALAKAGIKFFYHQHGYEFGACGSGTMLDLMMAETNPQFVSFEMDIFWVVFPGEDPTKWLAKYGKRWELMHLKDMKKGVKTGDPSGHTDVANDVALGAGQMTMPAILKAAKQAGVKWYFIEDESPSCIQQIPQSLRYLEQVKF